MGCHTEIEAKGMNRRLIVAIAFIDLLSSATVRLLCWETRLKACFSRSGLPKVAANGHEIVGSTYEVGQVLHSFIPAKNLEMDGSEQNVLVVQHIFDCIDHPISFRVRVAPKVLSVMFSDRLCCLKNSVGTQVEVMLSEIREPNKVELYRTWRRLSSKHQCFLRNFKLYIYLLKFWF